MTTLGVFFYSTQKALWTQLDLPAILVRYLLGEEPAPEEEVLDTLDKVFLYEKVAWAEKASI